MIESSSSEFLRGNGTRCNSQTECARLTHVQSQPIMISAHRASFPQILARELEFGLNLCASEVAAFVLIVLLPVGQPKAELMISRPAAAESSTLGPLMRFVRTVKRK